MSPEVERRVFGVLILHSVFPSVSDRGPPCVLVVVYLEADQCVRIRREQPHGFPAICNDTQSIDTRFDDRNFTISSAETRLT